VQSIAGDRGKKRLLGERERREKRLYVLRRERS
jgi:hypothetical protein